MDMQNIKNKIYIDTSDADIIVVGINGNMYKTKAHQKASQKLLPLIDDALKKNKMTAADISEIEVNTGPGSFTGLRVGVAVANALGWSLNIPVNGKNISKGESVEIRY